MEYLTIQQAAKKMGLSRTTIYRWIQEGKIKQVMVAGVKRIPAREFEEREL